LAARRLVIDWQPTERGWMAQVAYVIDADNAFHRSVAAE
jgi:hypothetical protein